MNKYWFIFSNSQLVIEKTADGRYTIPLQKEAPLNIAQPSGEIHNITPLNGIEVKTYKCTDVRLGDKYELTPLRGSYNKISTELYYKAGKCAEILYWDANTQFCGKCGGKMKLHTDISKVCTKCGKEVVETGETLEEAVYREVMEETGLKIKNLRYFSSQPWPYPCGLMVGFNADYAEGEIHLQRSELGDGGWFNKANLPEIPEKLSIARRLIDNWLENS